MAKILSSQYSSVFTKPSSSPYHDMEKDTDVPTLTDVQFTEKDFSIVSEKLWIYELSNTTILKTIGELHRPRDHPLETQRRSYYPDSQGLAANYLPVALIPHLVKVIDVRIILL